MSAAAPMASTQHVSADGRSRAGLLHRLIDPAFGDATLSRAGWLVVALCIFLFLAPTLAHPLAADTAMFFVSAQKILHDGAIHYRDIVDIKPPLIYYLFAGAMAVLGESALAVRFVDLLVQLATCALLAHVVRRCGGGDRRAALAAMLYALLYASFGFASTLQVESFSGPIVATIAWLQIARRGTIAQIAAGALAGIAALLKFPLAVTLGVVVLGALMIAGPDRRRGARDAALALGGFAAIIGCFALYLATTDAAEGFAQMNEFVSGYMRTRPGGLVARVSEIIEGAPSSASYALSLAIVLSLFASLVVIVKRPPGAALARHELLRYALLAFVLLALSVVAEGKYWQYHWSRTYAPASMLAAFGIPAIAGYLRTHARDRFARIAVIGGVALALLFSPLASWSWFTLLPAALRLRGDDAAFDAYYDRMAEAYPRSELRAVGRYVRRSLAPGDHLLVLSSVAALVHLESGVVPEYRVYHSAFLLADFAPAAWRTEIAEYFRVRRPAIVVVQHRDGKELLTGSNTSSVRLIDLLGLRVALEREYRIALETGRFVVYRRVR